MRSSLLPYGLRVTFSITLITLFSACKKEDITDVAAQVALVHAAPGVVNMDVVVNSEVKVPGFFYPNVTSGTSTPYRVFTRTETAPWTLQFKYSGTATELLSATPTWANGSYHSVVIYDTVPNLKLLQLDDDLSTPPDGYAKVRIVHVLRKSPETVEAVFNGTALGGSLSYGSASGYQQIQAGSGTFTVRAGGVDLLPGAGTEVNFQTRKIYTVYLIGIVGLDAASPLRPSALVVRSN